MMRVCQVISVPLPPEEGIGHHVWNLSRELQRNGHEVGIITRGSILNRWQHERLEGVDVWRVWFAPVYPYHVHLHAWFANRLFQRIEHQFDLVHIHTPLPPPIRSRLPIITTVHSPMKADTAAMPSGSLRALALRLQTPVSVQIEKTIFKRSSLITAVARWVAEALAAYGLSPDRIRVTGNGFEAPYFKPDHGQQHEAEILYVGRIDIGKGLEDLVLAARMLVDEAPDTPYRFVVIGQGPLQAKLNAQIESNRLEPFFELCGHIPQEQRDRLVERYQKAAIFVQPSHHEGMSTVLLEAMACGLPVVATNVGGAPEIIENGVNGLLVPVGSPGSLAAAIQKLIRDRALRAQLGQNAQHTVAKDFSWEAISQNYLGHYERLLSTQP